jgi:hypothetical protein
MKSLIKGNNNKGGGGAAGDNKNQTKGKESTARNLPSL